MKKDNATEQKMLTEVELELMTILWRLNEASVAEVITELPRDRKLNLLIPSGKFSKCKAMLVGLSSPL